MKPIKLLLLFFLVLFSFSAEAKDFTFSIGGGAGLDYGTWTSGWISSPTGTHHRFSPILQSSFQATYDAWRYKPTLEVSFRRSWFDFSTPQAPIQEANPEAWSIRIGLTRSFDKWDVYLLGGISFFNLNGRLVEILNNKPYHHGKGSQDIFQNLPSFKMGAFYKMVKISKTSIGPEFSIEAFGRRPEFFRCRSFETLYINPFLGFKIQY